MLDLARDRERMVEVQVARRGVRDPHVLAAMRGVPREAFVEPGFEEFAYEDAPLPIGEGQTISQPYIVALMIEAAELRPGDQVLEVGAGSGYAAAVMGQIANRVYAIERYPSLGEVMFVPLVGQQGWADAPQAITCQGNRAGVPCRK